MVVVDPRSGVVINSMLSHMGDGWTISVVGISVPGYSVFANDSRLDATAHRVDIRPRISGLVSRHEFIQTTPTHSIITLC